MSKTTRSGTGWYVTIVVFISDERTTKRRTAPAANEIWTVFAAKTATHFISPSAESIDDGQVVALVLCKLLPRRVRPTLLAERSLERSLIALRASKGVNEQTSHAWGG